MNITGGYLDYHGEFILNDEVLCTWGYDKKQNKYTTKHVHPIYNKGYKFLYANSPEELKKKIEKTLTN